MMPVPWALYAVGLLGGAAAQDAFDGRGIRFVPGTGELDDLVTVWPAGVGHVGLAAGLAGDYADATLVQVRQTQGSDARTEAPLLGSLVTTSALVRAVPHERLSIAVDLPVVLTSDLRGQRQGAFPGETRATLSVLAVDTEGFRLAVHGFGDLPTGATDRLLGNGPGFGARIALSGSSGPVDVIANLGGEHHPDLALENLDGVAALTQSLGIVGHLAPQLAVSAEIDGRLALQDRGVHVPYQALGTVRWRAPAGLSVWAGGGTGISRAAGVARVRAMLGVTYALDLRSDRDGDGLFDREDACVTEPEVVNGYADLDGCPDTLATVAIRVRDPDGQPLADASVRDGDSELGRTDAQGTLVLTDRMPGDTLDLALAPPDGRRFAAPEPQNVTLAEGEQDVELTFGWEPATFRVIVTDEDGNPLPATVTFRGQTERAGAAVGDGGSQVLEAPAGKWSLVIENEEYGLASQEVVFRSGEDGFQEMVFVLRSPEVEVLADEVVVLKSVQFDQDSDGLVEASRTLLDEVAANLLKSDLKKVEVQGHTSAEGRETYNVELSQRRMEAVVRYLVERGVSEDRLVPRGYGEACPLAPNTTEEGRAQNRRVQFIVIDPEPEDGIPCHDGNPARRAESPGSP